MSFFPCLSVVGLLVLTPSGSPFLPDCMGSMGKFYVPNLYIRQGHMPHFSLQNRSRSETITSGLGCVDLVCQICVLFSLKNMSYEKVAP